MCGNVNTFFSFKSYKVGKYILVIMNNRIKFWNSILTSLSFNTVNNISEKNYFNTFFPVERSTCEYYNFTYNDVWKCGNNFFQKKLENFCNSKVDVSEHNNGDFVFSFVRNPMKRFESAYREVAFRTTHECCTDGTWKCNFPQQISCDKLSNTTNLAIELLTKLFTDFGGNYHNAHFVSMQAFLEKNSPPVRFIGRLECLERDWKIMCSKFYCPEKLLNYKNMLRTISDYNDHYESSNDVYGHGKGLRVLFMKNKKWFNAVKKLVSYDDSITITTEECT